MQSTTVVCSKKTTQAMSRRTKSDNVGCWFSNRGYVVRMRPCGVGGIDREFATKPKFYMSLTTSAMFLARQTKQPSSYHSRGSRDEGEMGVVGARLFLMVETQNGTARTCDSRTALQTATMGSILFGPGAMGKGKRAEDCIQGNHHQQRNSFTPIKKDLLVTVQMSSSIFCTE